MNYDKTPELEQPVHGYKKFKLWVQSQHILVRFVYKALIAVFGFSVIVFGLILVPLPGPGWLIVFLGLGILGLEFAFANRLSSWAKNKVAAGFHKLKNKASNHAVKTPKPAIPKLAKDR